MTKKKKDGGGGGRRWTKDESKELMAWAKRSLTGLDESRVFMGILGDAPMSEGRVEFLVQLGYSVLMNKIIIIPAPYGVEIPVKLRAVADLVVRYDPSDPKTLEAAIKLALAETGALEH